MAEVEVFEKAREPVRFEASKLGSVRVQLYRADAASSPPNHLRAVVSCQAVDDSGQTQSIGQDVALSDVGLTSKELEALSGYSDRLVAFALGAHGFERKTVTVADPEPIVAAELSEEAAPRES